jgi:hypothetical protein
MNSRDKKSVAELSLQLRGAISMLKIVGFDDDTEASFKLAWRKSIKCMEAALKRYGVKP